MKTLLSRYALIFALVGMGSVATLGAPINFNQLPGKVRQTAQTELSNGPVKQVQSLQENGRTMYEITFQKPDGGTKVIYLNPDGSYVQNTGAAGTTGSAVVQGSAGASSIAVSQLPQAVQRTINTETRNGPVSNVTELTKNGQLMYRVLFNESNGKPKVIYLNPDGSYVRGDRGIQGWVAVNQGNPPLTSPVAVSMNALPATVQNAIRAQAGNAQIQSIQEGRLNGQVVYQANLNENGQLIHIRVGHDGNVVGVSR